MTEKTEKQKKYRLLKPTETIFGEDEFLCDHCTGWQKTVNLAGSEYNPISHVPIRREIKEPMSFDEWFDNEYPPESNGGKDRSFRIDMEECHEWTIENEKLKEAQTGQDIHQVIAKNTEKMHRS